MASGNNITLETADKISKYLQIKFSELFLPIDEKRSLSDKTVRHYHAFISSILSTAVVWQVIFANPCERVKPPKVTKKEAKYLEENELQTLLQILDTLPEEENQNCLMIKLLLSTGLRRGELCGLKWQDINFGDLTVTIKRNLLYLPNKGIFEDTPKTETSNRSVTLSNSIISLLNEHKKMQLRKQFELGDRWTYTDYLFTSWNGLPLHPDTISSWFKELVKKYNLPDVSVHSLRHTNATMLLMNGLPEKAVSSRLGHANVTTTRNIYSHALQSKDKEAAEIMDNILSKENRQNKKRCIAYQCQ